VTVNIPATTAGNSLAVIASLGTGNSHWVGSITDSSGSSWDPAKHVANAVSGYNGRAEIWWREGVPGGLTSLTVSLPAGQSSIGAWAIKVVELSGVATAAALDSSATHGNTATTTVHSGRATAAAAGELAVGAVATNGTGLKLASAGWTALSDLTGGSTSTVLARAAYTTTTTAAGQYEATWTGAAQSGGGVTVIFKPAT
jgi:hypothetical protein